MYPFVQTWIIVTQITPVIQIVSNTPTGPVVASVQIISSDPTIVAAVPTIAAAVPTIVAAVPTIVAAVPTIVAAVPTIVRISFCLR
jgi:hypothetical protein